MNRIESQSRTAEAKPPADADTTQEFTCAEQREVAETGSLKPYLRVDDPMCRAFLENGRDPAQFEGIRRLFPFIRTGSVYDMPRSLGTLHHWMAFAFTAGYDYGRVHPEELEVVLPREQEQEGLRRVGVLKQALGEERVTTGNLQEGFDRIVESNRQHYEGHSIHEVLAALTLRALRTGFAAATLAQTDPTLSEFLADLPDCMAGRLRSIMTRHWIKAPVRAHGSSPVRQLDHPLISMTRELHCERPSEQANMVEFMRQALTDMEMPHEDYCPGSPHDLIAWIHRGIQHGKRIQKESPERVERILADYPEDQNRGVLKMVRNVVRDARGTDAARLLGPLIIWQQDVHGWNRADCHGDRLGQITYMIDFAIWIPWALARAPKRKRRSAKTSTEPQPTSPAGQTDSTQANKEPGDKQA